MWSEFVLGFTLPTECGWFSVLHSFVKEWHFHHLFDCVIQLLADISFFESYVGSRIFDTFSIGWFGLEEKQYSFLRESCHVICMLNYSVIVTDAAYFKIFMLTRLICRYSYWWVLHVSFGQSCYILWSLDEVCLVQSYTPIRILLFFKHKS